MLTKSANMNMQKKKTWYWVGRRPSLRQAR